MIRKESDKPSPCEDDSYLRDLALASYLSNTQMSNEKSPSNVLLER